MSYLLHDVVPVMTRDMVMQSVVPVGFYADVQTEPVVASYERTEEIIIQVVTRYVLPKGSETEARKRAETVTLHRLYKPVIEKLRDIQVALYENYNPTNAGALNKIDKLIVDLIK